MPSPKLPFPIARMCQRVTTEIGISATWGLAPQRVRAKISGYLFTPKVSFTFAEIASRYARPVKSGRS